MKTIFALMLLATRVIGFCQDTGEADFGWYGTNSVEERNKIFPFNQAKKVMLVSYPNYELSHLLNPENSDYIDVTLNEAREHNPKYLSKILFEPAIYFTLEEKILTNGSIDELSHILCNYILKPGQENKELVNVTMMCYEPRNAVLFFDEKDNIICCFEICFECENSGLWPDPTKLNDMANVYGSHRYSILQDFFCRNGIKYGIE